MPHREFNFDGLVGPTHNYAGLSFGNVASAANLNAVANPKQAALQGLAKMHALATRGFPQAVLPPQQRPNFGLLRRLGFTGSEADMLAQAQRDAPALLASAWSASAMWTANAATVSPAADTGDGRTHFTVANLNNKLHRAQEQAQTARVLRAIFSDPDCFVVHDALPGSPALGDEGAANHTRLYGASEQAGVEIFVYGYSAFEPDAPRPRRYPARQTREASEAVARLHRLSPARTVLLQQSPQCIDQGVFHNDVIAVGNGNVLFYHADAFLNEPAALAQIRRAMESIGAELITLRVSGYEVSLDDAVATYLFNSQLLTRPDGRMLLLLPQECRAHPGVSRHLDHLLASGGPIAEVLALDLRQSMRNGGGPACLRLRVSLTEQQVAAMHQGVVLTDALYRRLVTWVDTHYRDRLAPADLVDPKLVLEVRQAMEELAGILHLPPVCALDE